MKVEVGQKSWRCISPPCRKTATVYKSDIDEPEQSISVNDSAQASPEPPENLDKIECGGPLGWNGALDLAVLRCANGVIIGVEACDPATCEQLDFENAMRSGTRSNICGTN